MATLHKGYDVKYPSPGEHKEMVCETCGDKMDVERDCYGPTGFAGSMFGVGRRHDRFTCPNAGQPWHTQIIGLLEAIKESPSSELDRIFKKEIEHIKFTRQPTKDVKSWSLF